MPFVMLAKKGHGILATTASSGTTDWTRILVVRQPLVIALGFLALVSLAPGVSPATNVVLVMCDDLGWGDVGFNGGKIIETPHLDRMAARGLRFSRFYAQSPVCSPTRGSCLTGRHPYRYGVYFANTGHIKRAELTLAELLRAHGYRTGHFGKWHLGTLTQTVRDANRGGLAKHRQHFSPPQENGFDVCFSTESKVPTYDPMRKPAGKARNAWDALPTDAESAAYGTHYWDHRGDIVKENLSGDNSRIIMDRAIPFIETAVADTKAFFAVIWFHTPHLPVVAGPEHQLPYQEVSNTLHRNYYGCVTAMDEQMGRLYDTLVQLKVQNDTLVCFCSDNGPEGNSDAPGSAGPFRGRKRSLYEGGIRVPSFIYWPREITLGRSTDYPAGTSDYLPTILDALNLKAPSARPLDGLSLLPLMKGQSNTRPKPIGFQSRDWAALSDNRFKIIGRISQDRKSEAWELYDLINDPAEQRDLADEHPELVSKMSRLLSTWQRSCRESDQGNDYQKP